MATFGESNAGRAGMDVASMESVSAGPEPIQRTSKIEVFLVGLFCLSVPALSFLMWTQRRLPPPASDHGAGIDLMMNYLMVTVWIMMVIGHVALAIFIWKFCSQDRVTFRISGPRTEWKIALIPCVVMALVAEGGVLAIGIPVWHKFFGSPPPSDSLVVEATAEQFAWTFRYPGRDGVFGRLDYKLINDENTLGLDPDDPSGRDDVVEPAKMTVPVNRPVKIRLRSKDVIHSLFLPYHRVQQDAVPGMTVDLWFTPNKTGSFEILCSQLCGLGHYRMRALMDVVPQEDFDRWQEGANQPKTNEFE